MRLALSMGRTLAELGVTMSAEEFGLWIALWNVEPWGDTRADYGFGMVASTIANFAGKMTDRHLSPLDFAPFLRDPNKVEEELSELDPQVFFLGMSNQNA